MGRDGQRVADSLSRQPFNDAQKVERFAAQVTTPDEATRLAGLRRARQSIEREIGSLQSPPRHWAGKLAQPKEATYVHRGGDPMRREVTSLRGVWPFSMASLPGYVLPVDAPEGERRSALARWIVDERNPLTSRVIVNRLWHYHFGTGIVDSAKRLGYLGGKPTHPELLGWLARRLREHGWRLAADREIPRRPGSRAVTIGRPPRGSTDGSRLLWRFPPRRLDAEEIRDTYAQGCRATRPEGGRL
jgi:hypothetical protein